jgi:hypothetical protein
MVKIIPAEFINVDLDLKSNSDPKPLLEAWGNRVIPIHVDKDGRRHWVRLTLTRQPKNPEEAIQRFCKLVDGLSNTGRAVWDKAATKEFDIGIQAGFDSRTPEWVLESEVIEAIAGVGARLRLTVYSPLLLIRERSQRKRRNAR